MKGSGGQASGGGIDLYWSGVPRIAERRSTTRHAHGRLPCVRSEAGVADHPANGRRDGGRLRHGIAGGEGASARIHHVHMVGSGAQTCQVRIGGSESVRSGPVRCVRTCAACYCEAKASGGTTEAGHVLPERKDRWRKCTAKHRRRSNIETLGPHAPGAIGVGYRVGARWNVRQVLRGGCEPIGSGPIEGEWREATRVRKVDGSIGLSGA